MISSVVSRASAAVLVIAGAGLLFAPDMLLPRLIPGFPPEGLWLGQLLGASWLALSVLNWLNRTVLLGGIYARPVVAANAVAYFVGATVLLKATTQAHRPGVFWFITLPMGLFAGIYAWLMFRGPLHRDFVAYSASLTRSSGPAGSSQP